MLIILGVGWRWLMQVTWLPTWSVKSLTHYEASGGSYTKPGSSSSPLFPRIWSCFCVNRLKASPLIIWKKPEISALTVTSMELIVSHFIEQQSWKRLLACSPNVSIKDSSEVVLVMEEESGREISRTQTMIHITLWPRKGKPHLWVI